MPYQRIPVRKLVRFVPDEAQSMGAALRTIAQEGRELATRLRGIDSELDSTWEGRARARFLAAFAEQPPFGESVCDWLEDEAGRIERIVVDHWEMVYEDQWVPE